MSRAALEGFKNVEPAQAVKEYAKVLTQKLLHDGKTNGMDPLQMLQRIAKHDLRLEKQVRTGEELPDSRSKLWESSQIISATPQTVLNDVKSGRVHLKNFVLSVFDEAHRCIKDYSYTALADFYMKQSLNPLILGLTASPGGSTATVCRVDTSTATSTVDSVVFSSDMLLQR